MSGGGQWRVLRHYLSLSNLHAEAEKLVQRVRPAGPARLPGPPEQSLAQHWEKLVNGVEAAMSVRLVEENKQVEKEGAPAPPPEAEEPVPASKPADKQEEAPAEQQQASSELSVEGLLQGLRRKKDLALGNISQPTWKDQKPLVNKSSIHSRTAYVISALASAQSSACRAKRAADFVHHIHQYPEARDYAIKEGAVRALLRVRETTRGEEPEAEEVRGVVNEALALVGWVGAPRGPGPSVLALDGGGIRGLIAISVLRQLERLTGRPVRQLFDFIAGVSTGAILAAVLCARGGSLDAAERLYRELSRDMFGNTSLLGGTSRLVLTHSYYDTAQWERLLRDHLGDLTLSQLNRRDCPKLALVSCVVNSGALSPFLWRTYAAGWRRRGAVRGSSAARVWQAVRASAAAPTYFEEFTLGGDVHQDGGILANNPCGVAVHEARLLYGAAALARGTVLSLGTGRPPAAPAAAAPTSWRDKFNKILDSATDTEGVHLLLNDLLPPGAYFRFNPPLLQPCSMDEVDPRKLQAMLTDTDEYIRRNQHKFEQAAARLVRERGLLQRAGDALHHRALLLGLSAHY